MSVAINIQHIKKQFSELDVLKDITLQIDEGEFFGLLGPNGAGKSTLINIMAGLTKPDSGYVEIASHNVNTHYRQSRKHLGVVPQEIVFDPFFTVRETLRIQSGYFGFGKENYDWIDYLIEALGLLDKTHSNMRSLSGGMKRRVLIAQALVHKPSVVVLDEPTAGVDVELRASLWQFVKELHRNGHTIVLTTHYLEEAENLCDRIAILNHGKIIALDSKEGLLSRNLEGNKRLNITLSTALDLLPNEIQKYLVSQQKAELVFDLQGNKAAFFDITDALNKAGAVISHINYEQADLEDIFLQITKENKQ